MPQRLQQQHARSRWVAADGCCIGQPRGAAPARCVYGPCTWAVNRRLTMPFAAWCSACLDICQCVDQAGGAAEAEHHGVTIPSDQHLQSVERALMKSSLRVSLLTISTAGAPRGVQQLKVRYGLGKLSRGLGHETWTDESRDDAQRSKSGDDVSSIQHALCGMHGHWTQMVTWPVTRLLQGPQATSLDSQPLQRACQVRSHEAQLRQRCPSMQGDDSTNLGVLCLLQHDFTVFQLVQLQRSVYTEARAAALQQRQRS